MLDKLDDARRPIVFFAEGGRGLQVVVCSPEAADWGIRVGMPVGEVQSLLPIPSDEPSRSRRRTRIKSPETPILKRADPAADDLRLRELAVHCQIYSPLVGLEEGPASFASKGSQTPVHNRRSQNQRAHHSGGQTPLWGKADSAPESIWLDISGSEALFGGEQGLAEKLRIDLAQQKIRVRVAIADTWGAAWAVSHFGKAEISLVPAGQQSEWLCALPVAALRLSELVKQSLQTLSVTTIGQLLSLPRASLPSRFGNELVRRIDQALGLAPEMLTVHQLAEPLFTEWLFEEPVADRQTLDRVCEVLLERLLTMLDERRAGLRELACHWLGTAAEPTFLRLLRPTTDRRHLLGLLRLQCERRVFVSGVHGVRMEVIEMGLPLVRQATLFGDDAGDRHPQAIAELVDRLSIRLGRQAVLRPRLTSDPQPEFSCESVAWLDEPVFEGNDAIPGAGIAQKRGQTPTFGGSQIQCETNAGGQPPFLRNVPGESRLRCRPLRLLQAPQPLSMQAVSSNGLPSRVNQATVVRISGPERIETGWWRGADVKRDYYCLDLANGTTLWTFLDRETGHWFLHGLFV